MATSKYTTGLLWLLATAIVSLVDTLNTMLPLAAKEVFEVISNKPRALVAPDG